MTKEELNTLINLNNKFEEACEKYVEKKCKEEPNNDWRYIGTFELDETGRVCGSGDVYSRNCFMETVHKYFDSDELIGILNE